MFRNIIFWIIVGGIAGWLAGMITRTGERMGCLLNVIVGVVGAVVGGWLFEQLDISRPDGGIIGTILVAFVGATLFLAILKFLTRGP